MIKLTEFQQKQLQTVIQDKNNNLSSRAKKKAFVVWLRYKKYSIKEISDKTKLSKRTIIYYTNGYLHNGSSFLHINKYKTSSLEKIRDDVKDLFKRSKPKSYKEASEKIRKELNVNISESATRRFLNKNKIYTKKSKKR